MQQHSSTTRPNAFTLIELLVVISIVAMLVALLLPALAQARDAGRTVAGMSNQRQLVIAISSYAVEYNGSFPPGKLNAFPWEWGVIINGYMKGEPPTYAGMAKLFRDPSATHQRKHSHYSVHPKIMPEPAYKSGVPMRVDQIDRATDILILADGTQQGKGTNYGFTKERCSSVSGIFSGFNPARADNTVASGPNTDNGYSPSGHIRYRQGNDAAANITFVDGHTATVAIGTLLQRNVRVDR